MKKLTITTLIEGFTIILLCLAVVRSGFDQSTFDIGIVINILFVLLLVYKVASGSKTIKLDQIKRSFFIIWIVFFLGIIIQTFTSGVYYDYRAAMHQWVLFILMSSIVLMYTSTYGAYGVFTKVLGLISIFSATILYFQWFANMVGVDLNSSAFLSEYIFKKWTFTFQTRLCAFFSEPSHMAEFGLLSLFFYLFEKKKTLPALYLTGSLFLTTSGLGVAGGCMLWGFYAINCILGKSKSTLKIVIVVIGILVVIVGTQWLENSDSWVAARLLNGGTSGMRVFRSLELFDRMLLKEKIFGVGLQNQANYLNAKGIILPSDYNETLINREYAQTAGYILCTTGLLGFIPCAICILRNLIKANIRLIAFMVLFAFVCITCCIFSRSIFVLYLLMMVFEIMRKTPYKYSLEKSFT